MDFTEVHQQEGHVKYDRRCYTCVQNRVRTKRHMRSSGRNEGREDRASLSVDIASCSKGGVPVLVTTVTRPRMKGIVSCMIMEDKSARSIRAAIIQAFIEAESVWKQMVTTRIHSDREAGLMAIRDDIQATTMAWVTATVGYDPKANGVSESSVGITSQLARCVVPHVRDESTRELMWTHAMRFAGIAITLSRNVIEHPRVTKDQMRPFMSGVLAWKPRERTGKVEGIMSPAVFLYPCVISPGAIVVAELIRVEGEGRLGKVYTTHTARSIKKQGKYILPRVIDIQAAERSTVATLIGCTRCTKARWVETSKARKLESGNFTYNRLANTDDVVAKPSLLS